MKLDRGKEEIWTKTKYRNKNTQEGGKGIEWNNRAKQSGKKQ